MADLILHSSPEAIEQVMHLFKCTEEEARQFLAAIVEVSKRNEDDAS